MRADIPATGREALSRKRMLPARTGGNGPSLRGRRPSAARRRRASSRGRRSRRCRSPGRGRRRPFPRPGGPSGSSVKPGLTSGSRVAPGIRCPRYRAQTSHSGVSTGDSKPPSSGSSSSSSYSMPSPIASGFGPVAVIDRRAPRQRYPVDLLQSPVGTDSSLHVDPGHGWFPHFLGFSTETGAGPGAGSNRNLPIAPEPGTKAGWLACAP